MYGLPPTPRVPGRVILAIDIPVIRVVIMSISWPLVMSMPPLIPEYTHTHTHTHSAGLLVKVSRRKDLHLNTGKYQWYEHSQKGRGEQKLNTFHQSKLFW